MAQARGRFEGNATRSDDFVRVALQSAQREQVDAAIEHRLRCVLRPCDVVRGTPLICPAALDRARTLVNDVRDAANLERLRAIAATRCLARYTHEAARAARADRADGGIAG